MCSTNMSPFSELLEAWRKTGNPIYPRYYDALVQDWVGHLPCRAGVSRDDWNASGGSHCTK